MFQYLKSLLSRLRDARTSAALRVAQTYSRFAGRYQVVAHVPGTELIWLKLAGESGRTPRLAITPKGGSDPMHLPVSRSDYQRVLSAYRRNNDLTVAILVEGLGDHETSSNYRQRDNDFGTSTSTSSSFEGSGGTFGGGGASGSWDAPSAHSTAQDVAAVAALTALGVVVAEDIGSQQASSGSEGSANAVETSSGGSDSGSDSTGYGR